MARWIINLTSHLDHLNPPEDSGFDKTFKNYGDCSEIRNRGGGVSLTVTATAVRIRAVYLSPTNCFLIKRKK